MTEKEAKNIITEIYPEHTDDIKIPNPDLLLNITEYQFRVLLRAHMFWDIKLPHIISNYIKLEKNL